MDMTSPWTMPSFCPRLKMTKSFSLSTLRIFPDVDADWDGATTIGSSSMEPTPAFDCWDAGTSCSSISLDGWDSAGAAGGTEAAGCSGAGGVAGGTLVDGAVGDAGVPFICWSWD